MNIIQFIHENKDVFFHTAVRMQLSGCTSILDVGCGQNSSIRSEIKSIYSEGIEIDKKSVIISKRNKLHNKYKVGDITKLDVYYKPKSFDVVVAMDVIEHLTKKQAFLFMSSMERIAKKKVIILTPNGFCKQGHYDNNPYQDHHSGWSTKDFKKRGYVVHGLRSFYWLRGEFATIKYKPWFFWGLVAFITEPILYFFPAKSFDLFAVKAVQS